MAKGLPDPRTVTVANGVSSCILALICVWLCYDIVVIQHNPIKLCTILVAAGLFSIINRSLQNAGLAVGQRYHPSACVPGSQTAAKFEHQFVQLCTHTAFALLEYFILFKDGGAGYEGNWYDDTRQLWIPVPAKQPLDSTVEWLYYAQLACWGTTTISHIMGEVHKDHLLALAHHVSTFVLVALSFTGNLHRVGTLILFLHDFSDLPCDLLRISNFLELTGRKYFFFVESLFVGVIFNWFWFRLWLMPTKMLYSAVYESRRYCDGGAGLMPDGSWNLGQSLLVAPVGLTDLAGWNLSILFLLVLQCLQFYWFYLFLVIAWNLVNGVDSSKAQQIYEGKETEDKAAGPTTNKRPAEGQKVSKHIGWRTLLVSVQTLLGMALLCVAALTMAFSITPIFLQFESAIEDEARASRALQGLDLSEIPDVHKTFVAGPTLTDEQIAFQRYYGFIHFRQALTSAELNTIITERKLIEKQLMENHTTAIHGVPIFIGACADGAAMSCVHRIPFGSSLSPPLNLTIRSLDQRYHQIFQGLIADSDNAGSQCAATNPHDVAQPARIGDREKDGVVLNSYVNLPRQDTPRWSRNDLGWHTDGLRDLVHLKMPPPMLNIGFHLDSVDPQYGDAALCLIPGTHLQSFLSFCFRKPYFLATAPDPDEICIATTAGDLTVHDGRLWHRVQASNKTGEASLRRTMFIPYLSANHPFSPKSNDSAMPLYHMIGKMLRWMQGGK